MKTNSKKDDKPKSHADALVVTYLESDQKRANQFLKALASTIVGRLEWIKALVPPGELSLAEQAIAECLIATRECQQLESLSKQLGASGSISMRSAKNWRTKAAEGLQTTDVLLRAWTLLAGVHRQQQPKSLSKDFDSLRASLGDALENGFDKDFIRTSFSVGAKILDAAEKATYMNYAYGIGLLEECQAEISGVEGRPELNDDQQHYLDFVKFTVEGLRHILLAGQATLQREHLVASSEWKRAAEVALTVDYQSP
jgi:hypothetical protein